MRSLLKVFVLMSSGVALGSCHGAPQPATAAARDPQEAPAVQALTAVPGTTAPASGYPMCTGQNIANAAGVARDGEVAVQLAPAYLDEMAACDAADGLPKEAMPTGDGRINAKGDCEFSNGVSCHYHTGSEFVTTSNAGQVAGQGELHCIFPSEEPKSPHVYGGHIVCRSHAGGQPHGAVAHEVKQGAVCSSAIVQQIAPCASFRCCDDGTLTSPIADLVRDHRNDIRPDFRICSDTLEIDCALLEAYTPHPANSPALGGVKEAVFAVPHH